METSSLIESLTEATSKIAEAESNLSAQGGSLGTRAAKDIPAAESEKDRESVGNMQNLAKKLASIREELEGVIEQLNND